MPSDEPPEKGGPKQDAKEHHDGHPPCRERLTFVRIGCLDTFDVIGGTFGANPMIKPRGLSTPDAGFGLFIHPLKNLIKMLRVSVRMPMLCSS